MNDKEEKGKIGEAEQTWQETLQACDDSRK
jgi:hypothetical protein